MEGALTTPTHKLPFRRYNFNRYRLATDATATLLRVQTEPVLRHNVQKWNYAGTQLSNRFSVCSNKLVSGVLPNSARMSSESANRFRTQIQFVYLPIMPFVFFTLLVPVHQLPTCHYFYYLLNSGNFTVNFLCYVKANNSITYETNFFLVGNWHRKIGKEGKKK